MNLYTIYVHDRRYSTPHFFMATVADDDRACELGDQRLRESDFHRAVEVFEDDRLVCRYSKDETPA